MPFKERPREAQRDGAQRTVPRVQGKVAVLLIRSKFVLQSAFQQQPLWFVKLKFIKCKIVFIFCEFLSQFLSSSFCEMQGEIAFLK